MEKFWSSFYKSLQGAGAEPMLALRRVRNNLYPNSAGGEKKIVNEYFLLGHPPRGFPKPLLRISKDLVFRPLRRATKGVAFGNYKLLKKLDQNFSVFF